MKRILLLVLFANVAFAGAFGQLAEATFTVRFNSITSFEGGIGGPCWESGDEEYTLAYARFFDNINTGTSGSGCFQCTNNSGSCTYGSLSTLGTRSNTSNILTANISAYENDRGNRCTYDTNGGFFDNDDDCGWVGNVASLDFRVGTNPSNGTYSNWVFGNGSHSLTYSYTWRYSGTSSSITPNCSPQTSTQFSGTIRSHSVFLTAGRTYRFQTTSGPDTYLRLYGSNGYSVVASNDDGGAGLLSLITYTPSSTGWYYIETSQFSRNSLSSNAVLEYQDVTTYSNDACSGAISVAVGGSVSGSTICAGGETLGTCGTSDGTGGGVWYRVTGNGKNLRASLCSGTNYDSKIRVYTGSCTSLSCVGGNDDACGLQSQYDWCSQVGTTYYILVHGFASSEGNFTLSISDLGGNTYYRDADGDGFGNPALTIIRCSQPSGYVANNTDCNDGNNTVYPGAPELCNGIDNNCNGMGDEPYNTYYQDSDGDGYGNPSIFTQACSPPSGYVTSNTDCSDVNNTIYPGAPEICNGLDNNCNGMADEPYITYYQDSDGDGFGNPSITTFGCVQPVGYVLNNTDCNDSDASTYPGAPDLCLDGILQDCSAPDGPTPTAITTNGSASGVCTSNGLSTWVPVVFPSDGNIIVAFNDNGHDLGDVTVTLLGVGNASISDVCGSGIGSFMGRQFRITTSNTAWQNGTNTVNVRFYFTNAELNSLITEAGCNDPNGCADDDDVCSIADVNATKYPNGNGPGGPTGTYLTQSGNGTGYGGNYVEFNVTEFSDFYLHGSESGVPLPVELTSFIAKSVDNQFVQLNWSTATEINNEGFYVQRSTDGENFENIAFVVGHGNTTEQQDYVMQDDEVQPNIIYYYRLKQVDFDGQFEYSYVRSARIQKGDNSDIVLIPNPANNTFTVFSNNEPRSVTVTNILGEQLIYRDMEKETSFKFDVTELSDGIYFVVLDFGDHSETEQLIIIK